jgi:hypothetical protein
MTTPERLIERLSEAGIGEALARATLPDWWSQDEAQSPSGRLLAALLLARCLNLDPETLLDDNVPIGFLHAGPTKFKHLRLAAGHRLDALTSYARGVVRIVLSCQQGPELQLPTSDAFDLHRQVIAGRDHVGFGDILSLCWALNIPVLHLRLFPAQTKGITAMSVRIAERYAILIARETGVPAQYMFHVAHELGHIFLGHLLHASTIVDADPKELDQEEADQSADAEEEAADAFAQTLLTGQPQFEVTRQRLDGKKPRFSSPQELAAIALAVGRDMAVHPAHVIMCFGNTTGEWALAQAAVKLVPDQNERPGTIVNRVFWQQLGSKSSGASDHFLRAVAAI